MRDPVGNPDPPQDPQDRPPCRGLSRAPSTPHGEAPVQLHSAQLCSETRPLKGGYIKTRPSSTLTGVLLRRGDQDSEKPGWTHRGMTTLGTQREGDVCQPRTEVSGGVSPAAPQPQPPGCRMDAPRMFLGYPLAYGQRKPDKTLSGSRASLPCPPDAGADRPTCNREKEAGLGRRLGPGPGPGKLDLGGGQHLLAGTRATPEAQRTASTHRPKLPVTGKDEKKEPSMLVRPGGDRKEVSV